MGRNEKREIAARRPARAPTHPGAILREDVIPAVGEAVANVARKLGVTRQHLYRVLAERLRSVPRWQSASGNSVATVPSFGFVCSRRTIFGTRNVHSNGKSLEFRRPSRARRES